MSSLYPYLLTVGVVVFLMILWLVVQLAWRRTFPEARGDEDVLAGRFGCHGCIHDGRCDTQFGRQTETEDCDQRKEMVH